eukprot:2225302-Rhodomonas_salina.3
MVQAGESAEGEDGWEGRRTWMRASSTCAAPATALNCPRTCTHSSRASDRIQPAQQATARKDNEPRAQKESRRVRKGHRVGPAGSGKELEAAPVLALRVREQRVVERRQPPARAHTPRRWSRR